MDNTPLFAGPRDLNALLQQIEQLQAAVTEQQRSLMMTREPQVKRVALHSSSELVSLLLDLREAGEQLDRQLNNRRKNSASSMRYRLSVPPSTPRSTSTSSWSS